MTPKTRINCVLVAATLFLSGGSRTTASIELHLNDVVTATLTQSASIMGTGQTSFALLGTSETWNSSQGGLLGWTHTTVTPAGGVAHAAADFYTACIEVLQNVYWGGDATWTVVDLATAPKPNGLNGLAGTGGMGADVAHLIDVLYSAHFTDAETHLADHAYAGAYQIAIWKLVYDGVGVVSSPNFSTGRLVVTSGLGDEEVTLAKQWLSGLSGLTGTSHPDVFALSSDGLQDQVYGGAPEPASLAVWSILGGSVAGLTLIRKRRATA